jgi:hypothetical protein
MEYYIGIKEEDEYSDNNKRRFIMKWKGAEYSTYIEDSYLEDKIIGLNNLEEFFDSTFNKKKFYDLDVSYDFFFTNITSMQLYIKLETQIHKNLKPFRQEFIFFLKKVDNRTWFQWITDIIQNKD